MGSIVKKSLLTNTVRRISVESRTQVEHLPRGISDGSLLVIARTTTAQTVIPSSFLFVFKSLRVFERTAVRIMSRWSRNSLDSM
jgi:hypothetical protein